MANNIGYDVFYAGGGPALDRENFARTGAKSAIFYVDPYGGPALYRGDKTAPTLARGLPIMPGGHIILVGQANIAEARWENVTPGEAARIHVLYYDQVDVVAADLIGRDIPEKKVDYTKAILDELRTMIAMFGHHIGEEAADFKAA